jgi:hypothetical protein
VSPNFGDVISMVNSPGPAAAGAAGGATVTWGAGGGGGATGGGVGRTSGCRGAGAGAGALDAAGSSPRPVLAKNFEKSSISIAGAAGAADRAAGGSISTGSPGFTPSPEEP